MRGAERQLDVARDHRPVAVATELVEAWFTRHAVDDVGLQFDGDVTRRARQCRSGGEPNLEDEKRSGGIRIEPGRGGRDCVNIVGGAGRDAECDDNGKCLQAVTEKCAGIFSAAQPRRQQVGRERGPRGADVARVETSEEPVEGLSGFVIR